MVSVTIWTSIRMSIMAYVLTSVQVMANTDGNHSLIIEYRMNAVESQDMSTSGGQQQHPTAHTSRLYCVLDYMSNDDNGSHHYHPSRDQWLTVDFDYYDRDLCSGQPMAVSNKPGLYGPPTATLKDRYVIIKYSLDCDVNQQIGYFRNLSIGALLVAVGCSVDIDQGINITEQTLLGVPFPVSVIADTSAESIKAHHLVSQRLKLFDWRPVTEYGLDYSIVCIWVLATATVCLGAYWSGVVRLNIFRLNCHKTKSKASKADSNKTSPDTSSKSTNGAEEEAFINLSPLLVLGFVLMMALMLLLLYYFFQYLVYLIIFLFTLASMASLFACLEPLVLYIMPRAVTKPAFILCSVRCGKMFYYQSVLLAVSMGVAITWVVLRREPYAWVLQDMLGVCFSLNMLRTIRLPSYKICVILLSALFFYDIFFVFITPLITSKGNSVMVDVATGGSGKSRCGTTPGEQIPMVMRIPHNIFRSPVNLTESPADVCVRSTDSLLGFGDILVPGLLVSYCHAFDLIFKTKYRIYYVITCVGYALGLIATFAGLYLMSGSAQPALLYLVPFTTIPPILIALYRRELRQLWMGPEYHFQTTVSSRSSSGSKGGRRTSPGKSTANTPPSTATTISTGGIEDNNLLISSTESGQSVDH